jgi:WhiB family transcriptional regulator, redox-sensing transcriptional regulator
MAGGRGMRITRLQWSPGAAGPVSGEHWDESAFCREFGTELFYPDKGGDIRLAQRVCARCPVTAQCLEFALDHMTGEFPIGRFGVWGGTGPEERMAIRRRMRRERRAA